MCYFTDPKGGETGLFPYSIMDSRNNPIKCERITANDIRDSHRRALAACAAGSVENDGRTDGGRSDGPEKREKEKWSRGEKTEAIN